MSKHQTKSHIVMSLVDIVIPVFNRSDLLKRCLEYIPGACQKNPFSIYVFDNGSTLMGESNNIRSYCEQAGAMYLRNGVNLGFPTACNRAANKGISPLIFFLNDDVFLVEESIDKLVNAMDEPTFGVAGMRLLFPLDSNDPSRPAGKIQHVGISTNIRGEFTHQFVSWSPENPRTKNIKHPLAVTGAAMMTRRKLFKQARGFFEGYGMGCLVGDTLIITEKGIFELSDLIPDKNKELSDISIYVASEYNIREANLAYVNGESETIKVKLEKDFSIQGTPNHRVRIMSKEGKVEWKQLNELTIGDYVGVRYGTEMFGKNNISMDGAYLMGLYIAEGSYEKCGRITITNADIEIQQFLDEKYGFHRSQNIKWRKQSVDFCRWLSTYIDLSEKALTKEIPKFYLRADKTTQIAFLQGLFDGDGCAIKDGRVNYSTSSYKLAKQLQIILLNFGIIVGIYPRKSDLSINLNYLLDFGSDSGKFYSEIGFRLSRKQANQSEVRDRKTEIIPYQRKYFRSLYGDNPIGSRNWKELGAHNNAPSEGVRRDTIELLIDYSLKQGKTYVDDIMSHFGEILSYNCVWLKVKSIEDGDVQPTFDIHVPDTHAYIANGLIVHNTYEDVDYCLTIRDMGYNIYIEHEAIGFHLVGATAVTQQVQYPLNNNRDILRLRWKDKIYYSEWENW